MKLDGRFLIDELHIQFQGGFAGRDCALQGLGADRGCELQGGEISKNEYKNLIEFYPEDSNSLQVSFTNH